jgi:hypothetical protein
VQWSQNLLDQYKAAAAQLSREEKQLGQKIKANAKKLQERKKQCLVKPHAYANYLVSLNLLQQE